MRENVEREIRRIAWEVAIEAIRPQATQAAIDKAARWFVETTAREVATHVTRELMDGARLEADEVRRIAEEQALQAAAESARAAMDDVREESNATLHVVRAESTAAIEKLREESDAALREARDESGAALREVRQGAGTALRAAQEGTNAALSEAREGTETALREAREGTGVALRAAQEGTEAALREAKEGTGAALREAREGTGAALSEARQGAEVALREAQEAAGAAVRETRKVTDAALRETREVTDAALREARDETSKALTSLREARDGASVAIESLREESDTALRGMVEKGKAALLAFARDEAARVVAEMAPHVLEVVLPEGERIRVRGFTHAVLPDVLTVLNARCHVLLVGPAGTGKSMMAKQAAEALGLELQALSLGPTTPMSKIFGYYDAHGKYHETPFRRAFERGGLMLLDELDSGHPGLLAELNQALAIGTCAFADGMVDAHPDFRLIATANTYGTGGDRQYVGRQALDAATLDRFVIVDVPVDEELEEHLALAHAPAREDETRQIIAEVRRLRATAEEKRLPVMFSPRASIDAAKLIQAGASVDQAVTWRIVRGMSAAHRAALGIDS
jgi:MoxR-like ATPase